MVKQIGFILDLKVDKMIKAPTICQCFYEIKKIGIIY